MSLITILEALLIGPLKLIFEIIFVIAERIIGHPGLAIISLSLVINVLMMPLYRRADAIQEEARDKEALLRDGVAHIKKTFTGDERMMILQTYYRQNNYRPTDVLKGSVSLLLEVPFFMAAYQFLSNLTMLSGVSLGPITDLGAPDGMLVIGGIAINVLPILMTTINIFSGMVFSKDYPLKTKIQIYGLALLFLVILYQSPSGLVFYWTLNNLFSLIKNLCKEYPAARKAGAWLLMALGVAAVIFGIFIYSTSHTKRKIFIVGAGLLLMLPVLLPLLKGKVKLPQIKIQAEPNKKLFFLGSLFLTILTGMLIPSTYIAASPQEYVYPTYYHDPLLYVLMATCLAAGLFLVWMGVFYWLVNPKAKTIFGRVIWILCGVMLVNYMFFGKNLGTIYSNLRLTEKFIRFEPWEEKLNLLVLAAVSVVLFIAARKWEKKMVSVLLAGALALGGMSAMNMITIDKETKVLEEASVANEPELPSFRLSKDGQNVVVIMLDRGISQMIPYLFNEKPELVEQFDGFTHYQNAFAFGRFTVFGSPGLVGGYEYTPVEMNKRSDEELVDKHNEALKVMPVLFSENGYETTVVDPPYANYQWVPDLSIYDEYPAIKAYRTNGAFVEDKQIQVEIDANYRNFFCFSIMKCAPLTMQKMIYFSGTYNQAPSPENVYAGQVEKSISKASGYKPTFLDEYSVLCNMDSMTRIVEGDLNTYMFIDNDTIHESMLLQAPDYVPAETVDNTAYDAEHAGRFELNGKKLNVKDTLQMRHYHSCMAAMLRLGEWFDYLRENDVYDNTRIIIASDHAYELDLSEELLHDIGESVPVDVGRFNCLLMVKDFGSTGFATSDEFMTNADVPTLSVKGLIENPTNPFTGKPINSDEKYAHEQVAIRSDNWGIVRNNGTTFEASQWASVKDDVWNRDNWNFTKEPVVLKEHKIS